LYFQAALAAVYPVPNPTNVCVLLKPLKSLKALLPSNSL
jgi:hypothetical protein